jgi:hypothetical protein
MGDWVRGMDKRNGLRGMESALWDCRACGGLPPAAGVRVAYSFWLSARYSCLRLSGVFVSTISAALAVS